MNQGEKWKIDFTFRIGEEENKVRTASPVRSQRTPKWEEVLRPCWVLKYGVLDVNEWTWILSTLSGLVHDVKSKEDVSFLVLFPIKSIRKAIRSLMTVCLQKIS